MAIPLLALHTGCSEKCIRFFPYFFFSGRKKFICVSHMSIAWTHTHEFIKYFFYQNKSTHSHPCLWRYQYISSNQMYKYIHKYVSQSLCMFAHLSNSDSLYSHQKHTELHNTYDCGIYYVFSFSIFSFVYLMRFFLNWIVL